MKNRILVGVLAVATFGCTTFGVVPPKEFITAKRPAQVWVYKADSSVVLVRGPHFLAGGDTLVGLIEGSYQEVPLSDVRQVKATRQAPMRTLGLVVGGVGIIVGTTAILKKSRTPNDSICILNSVGCDVSNQLP